MSYSALARKWRPKSFAELKGQDFVVTALSNALARNQLHHAYLFTGTRGVGKTTIARIFAKCLNCEQGVTNKPCNQCTVCQDIDEGRFLDLIEVDAASKTKVEQTRELLDNVIYAPVQGRYKIYLIDEVHMLSGHSFNALLKTLEEPPAHVKFILATTDPERIPVTVLSRCLTFNLRALAAQEIIEQLTHILQSEKIPFDERALSLLAYEAKGSMRDGLSLLEQAISFGDGEIHLAQTQDMLGLQYQQHLPMLLQAIFAKDASQVLKAVEDISKQAADFEDILEAIAQALYSLSLKAMLPTDSSVSQLSHVDANLLNLTIPDPEVLQLFYQIALMGKRDLVYAPNSRVGFEMTLLRMVAFFPIEPDMAQSAVSKPHSVSVKQNSQVNRPNTAPKPRATATSHQTQTSQAETKTRENSNQLTDLPASHLPEAEPHESKVPSSSTNTTPNWVDVTKALPLVGLTKVLLKHCTVLQWQDKRVVLALEPSQEACLNPARKAQIQKALSDYLGYSIGLEIVCETPDNAEPTPMKQAETVRKQAQKQAEKSVDQDENVQNILDTFGATIEKISTSEE